MIRLIFGAVALLCCADAALACSPPPSPEYAQEMAREVAAQVDKRKTSLVEAVVVRDGHWPDSGAMRVMKVHWGKLKSGTLLTVQPQPRSACGPEVMYVGEHGFVLLSNDELRQRPRPFHGFMAPYELDAYKDRGLIER